MGIAVLSNSDEFRLLQFDFESVTTKIHGEGPLGFCQLMGGKVGLWKLSGNGTPFWGFIQFLFKSFDKILEVGAIPI